MKMSMIMMLTFAWPMIAAMEIAAYGVQQKQNTPTITITFFEILNLAPIIAGISNGISLCLKRCKSGFLKTLLTFHDVGESKYLKLAGG